MAVFSFEAATAPSDNAHFSILHPGLIQARVFKPALPGDKQGDTEMKMLVIISAVLILSGLAGCANRGMDRPGETERSLAVDAGPCELVIKGMRIEGVCLQATKATRQLNTAVSFANVRSMSCHGRGHMCRRALHGR